MTVLYRREWMIGIILLAVFAVFAMSGPALAAQSCPKGKVNCQEHCRDWVDNNGNGICDKSESGSTSKSNSTNSTNTTSNTNPNQNNTQSKSSTTTQSTNQSSSQNASSASNSGSTVTSNSTGSQNNGSNNTQNAKSSSASSPAAENSLNGTAAAGIINNAVAILGAVIILVLAGGVYLGRISRKE